MSGDEGGDGGSRFILADELALLLGVWRLASDDNVVLPKEIEDRVSGDAELLRESLGGLTCGVPLQDSHTGLGAEAA